MRKRSLAVGLALMLLIAGCGGDDVGAEEATQKALADELVAQGIDRDTADCVATGLVDEFGVAELEEFAESGVPSPDVGIRTLDLFDECGLAVDLDTGSDNTSDGGSAGGDTTDLTDISDFRDLASPRESVDGPYTYGDDTDLDALWEDCEGGSGSACDDLYFDSPVGSEYEAFGNTCGNRLELNFLCDSLDE